MEKIRLRELQDLKGLLDSNMHLTEAQEQRFCDLAFDYHVEQLMKGDGHDYSEEKFPGVFKAVNELLGEPDILYADHSWIKFLS